LATSTSRAWRRRSPARRRSRPSPASSCPRATSS
jgi:hypothetical protein